ncbi:MAG: 50S ribosomal protein L29 [Candidatus Stahlbacteria bacterium]|jgi:large subunit ribosomal protein L29|nr:50S ribosomal protein L29 [candidate division WOR-3 bacterium]TET98659.1 MAG: 50S ribosomal protein L29 [Candidatus Stahlbacteria bacterium]
MKVKEIREMTTVELNSLLHDLKEELFSLRFQKARGNLTNTARFKQIRKEIARVKTVFNEMEKKGGDQEEG